MFYTLIHNPEWPMGITGPEVYSQRAFWTQTPIHQWFRQSQSSLPYQCMLTTLVCAEFPSLGKVANHAYSPTTKSNV